MRDTDQSYSSASESDLAVFRERTPTGEVLARLYSVSPKIVVVGRFLPRLLPQPVAKRIY